MPRVSRASSGCSRKASEPLRQLLTASLICDRLAMEARANFDLVESPVGWAKERSSRDVPTRSGSIYRETSRGHGAKSAFAHPTDDSTGSKSALSLVHERCGATPWAGTLDPELGGPSRAVGSG